MIGRPGPARLARRFPIHAPAVTDAVRRLAASLREHHGAEAAARAYERQAMATDPAEARRYRDARRLLLEEDRGPEVCS